MNVNSNSLRLVFCSPAPQSFSHHSGAVHQPQPSSTPTGNQPPPQHAAPSPGQVGDSQTRMARRNLLFHSDVASSNILMLRPPLQNAQSGPQPPSLYHSGPLSAPTPPNMPPGHTSPQGSYPIQSYGLHSHQGIPPTYPLGQIAQVWIRSAPELRSRTVRHSLTTTHVF